MSATICIVEGTGAGESRWIEFDVSRIGSRPECEVRIEGLPPHALTLQYRGGEYFVFNRGNDSLYLDGLEILPAQASRWEPQHDLQIGTFSVLRLEIAGDPAPAPRPVAMSIQQRHQKRPDDAPKRAGMTKNNEHKQIVLIATCLVATLMFLILAASTPAKSSTLSQYESVVQALSDATLTGRGRSDLELAAMTKLVRAGFRDEMQSRPERAIGQYYQARNVLLRRSSAGRNTFQEAEQQAMDFVQQRIALLAD
jgi:hypothetical protein